MRMSRKMVLKQTRKKLPRVKYSLHVLNTGNFIGTWQAENKGEYLYLELVGKNSVLVNLNRPTAECFISGLIPGDNVSVTWSTSAGYTNSNNAIINGTSNPVNTTAEITNQAYSFVAESTTVSVNVNHGYTTTLNRWGKIHSITVNGIRIF